MRLEGYDYSQPGAYFVTICTHNRACLFGEVVDGVVCLNEDGAIVHEEWFRTAAVRPTVRLVADECVIMPNHVHGIIRIVGDDDVGATRRVAPTGDRVAPTGDGVAPTGDRVAPTGDRVAPPGDRVAPPGDRVAPTGDRDAPPGDGVAHAARILRACGPMSGSIGAIVGQFKSITAKRINARRDTPGAPVWQRSYYEHIIRSDEALERIRQYILDNPVRWNTDSENPAAALREPDFR